jgi:hypothetical protein
MTTDYYYNEPTNGENPYKAIIQIDSQGHLAVFRGVNEASKITGIPNPNIFDCLSGKRKSAGGYKWELA